MYYLKDIYVCLVKILQDWLLLSNYQLFKIEISQGGDVYTMELCEHTQVLSPYWHSSENIQLLSHHWLNVLEELYNKEKNKIGFFLFQVARSRWLTLGMMAHNSKYSLI